MVLAAFGSPSAKVDYGLEVFEVAKDEEDDYIIVGAEEEEEREGEGEGEGESVEQRGVGVGDDGGGS